MPQHPARHHDHTQGHSVARGPQPVIFGVVCRLSGRIVGVVVAHRRSKLADVAALERLALLFPSARAGP